MISKDIYTVNINLRQMVPNLTFNSLKTLKLNKTIKMHSSTNISNNQIVIY